MAYLDDNNDNLYTQGDPLEDLDKELAELKATLGKLEGGSPAETEENTSLPAEKPQKAPEEEPASFAEEKTDGTVPAVQNGPIPEASDRQTPSAPVRAADKPSNGKRRLPLIITAVILAAALIVGVGYVALRSLAPRGNGSATPTSAGEMVTISDSVMGDIELQTVKGAEINTYTAENLVTDGNGFPAYYEDGKKISHLGADLSEYQGEVDFAAMKAAGVEFVMLRIGGRYYGESGGLYEDKAFDTYYDQAKAAGLKVGAYFFSQAVNTDDAAEEASFALEKLNGRALDYPIALDWENIADDEARTDSVTGDMLTVIAETFCDTVTESGYKAIVYANTGQMFIMYDFETMKDYDFWLADYREFPTMYYKFDMWQYTLDGTIDGVEGTVDLNLSFTDFS